VPPRRKKSSSKTTRRSKKSSRKPARRQSKKRQTRQKSGKKRYIRGAIFLVFTALLGLTLWSEYQVLTFLSHRQKGDFGVLGIEGRLEKTTRAALPILNSSPTKRAAYSQVTLGEFSPHIIQAVLTTEDRRFYEHIGVDVWGIGRALLTNIRSGSIVQGASTITQQLAKNLFLSPRRTVTRKIHELFIAILLELHLSKEEILSLYLNEVYLGQEGRSALHGMEAAAQSFFRKSASEVSVDEAALLAGIIKAPSSYNPRRYLKRAIQRRNIVLAALHDEDYLTASEEEALRKTNPTIHKPLFTGRYAPFFEIVLERSLAEKVNLEALRGRGAQVVTGLSRELQLCGEEALSQGLKQIERNFPTLRPNKERSLQGGLVALDPTSGLIRAWIGGREYSKNQFDHVSQAKRPIGSTVKPFIYLTALDPALNTYKTATLRSTLPDQPISVKLPNGDRWEPSNSDRKFRGKVTLRYALEHSLNLPPIHITRQVGVETVQKTLQRFELHPNPPAVLSLALGTLETNLLSLTAAYGALANHGVLVRPRLFDRIEDGDGDLLYSNRYDREPVADPGATFLLKDALQGVISRGTGKNAQPQTTLAPLGGKTGTSQKSRDAWFIGMAPQIVAGVWVGYDDNTSIRLGGGSAAAPIWRRFIECSSPYLASIEPLMPLNIVRSALDSETGELFSDRCPEHQQVYELFLRGTAPKRPCTLHGGVILSEDETLTTHQRRKNGQKRKGFFERFFGN